MTQSPEILNGLLPVPSNLEEAGDLQPLKKLRSSSFVPEGSSGFSAAPTPPLLSPTTALNAADLVTNGPPHSVSSLLSTLELPMGVATVPVAKIELV